MDLLNLLGKTWIDELKYPTDLGFGFKQHMPDRELFPLLKKINLQEGNHFIILHQRGSHMPYGKILAAEQKVFGDKTANDEYDNTIYATDQLMKAILHYLEQQSAQDWLFVYTSDHGQFVILSVIFRQQWTKIIILCQRCYIPLTVCCNNNYIKISHNVIVYFISRLLRYC